MAKIKKIQESGETIYPATITNAIKDVESGSTLAEILENKEEEEFFQAPKIEFIRPVAKDYNGYIGEEPKSIEESIAGDYQIKISHPYYEKHKDECLLVIMKYGTLKRNINVPTLAENSQTYFKPRTKWNFFKGGLGNDSLLTINNTIDENGFVTIRNFVDKILSRGVLKWRNEEYFIVAINYGDAEDALGVDVKSYTDDYDSLPSTDFITNGHMLNIYLNKNQKEQKFGIAVIKTNPEFVDADNLMDINEQHNICWSNGKYRWLISDITPFYMHVNPPITGTNTVNQHFISISK